MCTVLDIVLARAKGPAVGLNRFAENFSLCSCCSYYSVSISLYLGSTYSNRAQAQSVPLSSPRSSLGDLWAAAGTRASQSCRPLHA